MLNTKEGNAVILSEEEYNETMETLYLYSMPETREKILEGLNTALNECISESEVEW